MIVPNSFNTAAIAYLLLYIHLLGFHKLYCCSGPSSVQKLYKGIVNVERFLSYLKAVLSKENLMQRNRTTYIQVCNYCLCNTIYNKDCRLDRGLASED